MNIFLNFNNQQKRKMNQKRIFSILPLKQNLFFLSKLLIYSINKFFRKTTKLNKIWRRYEKRFCQWNNISYSVFINFWYEKKVNWLCNNFHDTVYFYIITIDKLMQYCGSFLYKIKIIFLVTSDYMTCWLTHNVNAKFPNLTYSGTFFYITKTERHFLVPLTYWPNFRLIFIFGTFNIPRFLHSFLCLWRISKLNDWRFLNH